MTAAAALGPRPGDRVLDLCAAPGGKSTQLAAMMNGEGALVCNEPVRNRAQVLARNVERMGVVNAVVTSAWPEELAERFPEAFDAVMVDAPCSGSGTLRAHDPRTAKRFTRALIDKSLKAQKALLDKALGLVKPGGTVVYSTCSVLACENEEALAGALKRIRKRAQFEVQPVELPGADDLPTLPCSLEGALCLAPNERYEGFFVAKVKRIA